MYVSTPPGAWCFANHQIPRCRGCSQYARNRRCLLCCRPVRSHLLESELRDHPGIVELCPGMQSVLVMYDHTKITEDMLVSVMVEIEKGLDHSNLTVPSRLIKLPIAFNDDSVLEAVERYSVGTPRHFPRSPTSHLHPLGHPPSSGPLRVFKSV